MERRAAASGAVAGAATRAATAKGISGDGGLVEVSAVASGHASARGSTSSKERRVAELLAMVAQRGVDGERDYGEGAAEMASAMARESEGEVLGGGAGVCEVGESCELGSPLLQGQRR